MIWLQLTPPRALQRGLTQIPHDLPELLKRRFEISSYFLGNDVGIGEVVGGFEGFVLEPEDIKAVVVVGVIKCRPDPLALFVDK